MHSTGKVLGSVIYAADGRQILLDEFLRGSPMEGKAEIFVTNATKYGIDYRLLPAIAMCESNLGKRIPSSQSFNAWGIGVYSGQHHGATFASWDQAIEWVNYYVYEKFTTRQIVDIYEIGAIWAPPSVENGNSWANCVKSFMEQIE
ncbi:hypothetical protein A2154_04470 [Candidatus Gottesmanbacteria bacterium RBG_16_43_7]|uniref:Mannosyl-glycoprotein endo-beta-N-acetylglucosamidase-like domain-containing protein n=1 Tax=Candidatus Gottesmanbacteria bacterium RBG_16_43_7 TaxID=1798373 RepID=A0A1F5Z827_9BACT|nr:MAG: hypothetical protein A2154_04470 [Candidatus Gottesmanbacteria bacterium RBG_16_43_7]